MKRKNLPEEFMSLRLPSNRVLSLRIVNGWLEITTTSLDRHNDHIQIYAKPEGREMFILTDDGAMYEEMAAYGFTIENKDTQKLVQLALNQFNATLVDEWIQVRCIGSRGEIGFDNIVAAMLCFDDVLTE